MNTQSRMKDYVIPVVGTVVTAIDTTMSLLGNMPWPIALLLLALGAVMIIPFVWKNIRERKSRWITSIICSLAFVGFGIYLFKKRDEAGKSLVLNAQQKVNHSNNTSSTNVQSNQAVNHVNGNTNSQVGNNSTQIIVSAPVKANALQIGNGNTLNVKNYDLPEPRHLNAIDLIKLRSITESAQRINVLYPGNNKEAEKYAVEIRNKLFDLGHKVVASGPGETSLNTSKERFNISPIDQREHSITIFINPQF
jgi:hypothetical protein